MPFKIFHDDELIAEFKDEFMEPKMDGWKTQYVSGTLNLEKETLVIYIERKKEKKI